MIPSTNVPKMVRLGLRGMKALPRIGLAALIVTGLVFTDAQIPLLADVRVKERITFKDLRGSREVNRIIEIKDLQMRIEGEASSTVMIYSVEAGKRFRLDASKKEVFVLDLLADSRHMEESFTQKKLSRELQANGKKSRVAGQECDEYTFELQAPFVARGLHFPSEVVGHHITYLWDRGTVCLSTVTGAGSDFSNFIREALKRGYSSAVLPISPTLSPIGPYFFEQDTNLFVLGARTESSFKYDIPPSDLPRNLPLEKKAIITEISSDMIPDEDFKIPADWKLSRDKDSH